MKVRFLVLVLLVAIGSSALVYGQYNVSVKGWSQDGKVLVVFSSRGPGATTSYVIQDLISDDVLWSNDRRYNQIDPDQALDVSIAKYKIQESNNEATAFPYKDQKLGQFDIECQDMGKDAQNWTKYIVAVTKAGGKSKVLGSFNSATSRPTGKYQTIWFRSPFSDRLLVVVGIEFLHPEFDNKMYDYNFFGCHLEAGF